jgi:hypothetical protein
VKVGSVDELIAKLRDEAGVMPNSRLSCASEACDRCIAALTACPRHRARTGGASLARSWRCHDELVP